MRVLMIRHAEFEVNMVMARLEVEYRRNGMDVDSAWRLLRNTTDMDGPLTDMGCMQAAALGQFWAPLLKPYDDSGRLHIYVSPSVRTLQTVAPLAKRLKTSPIMKPEITEAPGMIKGTDRSVVLPKLSEAERRGDWDEVKRIDAEMEGKWTRHGLTRKELLERFPGYKLADSFVKDDGPWYTYGAESVLRRRSRFEGVIRWLREMAATLPNDHVVVLVSHSNAIRNLMQGILYGWDPARDVAVVDNTSVTSIVMNERVGSERQRRGQSSSNTARQTATSQPQEDDCEVESPRLFGHWGGPSRINLEFVNRVDHLVAVHEMDRLSGILHGASPEQYHYDNDPHHDAFMNNLHEASTLPDVDAARKLLSKL
eukprot:m.162570 g.162570  ORF g.162570 m.162570 type:complete len:369 (+) comp12213_c0_seq1:110-1216(+)